MVKSRVLNKLGSLYFEPLKGSGIMEAVRNEFYCPNCNRYIIALYSDKCPDCGCTVLNIEHRITQDEHDGYSIELTVAEANER